MEDADNRELSGQREQPAPMHDEKRPAESRMDGHDLYQVWLNDDEPVERIYQMFGLRMPAFPSGFFHVADVVAGSVDQAYWKAHADGNVLDPHDTSWKDWQKNEGVRVLLPDKRGADFGDVIVSPDGKAHQLINGGFREIARTPARQPEGMPRNVGRSQPSAGREHPSPSGIAADNSPSAPGASLGRTKGRKP